MARTKKNTAPVSTLTSEEAFKLGHAALLADGGPVALAEITRRAEARIAAGKKPVATLIAEKEARKAATAEATPAKGKGKGKGKAEATPAAVAAAAPRKGKKAQIQAALQALVELLG